MLKFNLCIFFFMSLLSFNLKGQTPKNDNQLLVLHKRYGNLAIEAVFVNENTRGYLDTLKLDLDWINYQESILNLKNEQLVLLLSQKIDKNQVTILEKWCVTYCTLTHPFLENDDLFFEEIVSEHSMSSFLLKKYIQVKGQGWYSLSTRESIKFSNEVITYVSSLPLNEKFDYYIEFISICKKRLEN